jgi:hypothetical protein
MSTALETRFDDAAAAMVAACSHTTERQIVREQPVVQQQPSTVERVTVLAAAGAPQEAMPGAARAHGYTWVPGHYAFRNGAWTWESGSGRRGTVPPMPSAMQEPIPPAPYSTSRWVPGYWTFADNSWTWVGHAGGRAHHLAVQRAADCRGDPKATIRLGSDRDLHLYVPVLARHFDADVVGVALQQQVDALATHCQAGHLHPLDELGQARRPQ